MAHDEKKRMSEPAHDDSYTRNPGGAHEHRDVNIRAVFGFLITLLVVAIFIQLALFGMFKYLRGSYRALDPEPNPMLSGQRQAPQSEPARDFPQPRLQADPVHDLNKMRVAEEKILNGPPVWLDEKAGIVRIPIDQAMQLTLQRGMPLTGGAASQAMTLNQPPKPAPTQPKTKGATK